MGWRAGCCSCALRRKENEEDKQCTNV
jgi:hypothetical protein